MFDFLDFNINSGVTGFVAPLVAVIVSGILFFFFSDYIILLVKWFLSKISSIGLVLIIILFLNLAGPLVAYTVFHLHAAIILAIASYTTEFTAGIVGGGFTGLFCATIGILIYKLLK